MKEPAFFERMDVVDALRGFALMGLFILHCTEFFELFWAHPDYGWVHTWTFGLFGGKAFALFALCFGLSFHIIMDRSARRGTDFTLRFAWRLAILIGFGILHGLVYRGDILLVLAPLGLLLLALNRIRNNWVLLGIAIVFYLQPSQVVRLIAALAGADWALAPPMFWGDPTFETFLNGSLWDVIAVNAPAGNLMKLSFYWETGRIMQIIALFVTGLILGRIGFFRDLTRFVTQRRMALVALSGMAVAMKLGEGWALAQVPSVGGAEMARESARFIWTGLYDTAFMGVQVLLFLELWRGIGKAVLGVLAAPGRMTLTLYILQSVIFVPLFYGFGFGLHDDLTQPQALALGIAAFAAQIVAAHFWYRHFRYGPLEWVWRALTYTSLAVPFRRKSPGLPDAAA